MKLNTRELWNEWQPFRCISCWTSTVRQQIIEKRGDGIIISIRVQLNYELEKEILGFGEGMIVLEPLTLRTRINGRLINAAKAYQDYIRLAEPGDD